MHFSLANSNIVYHHYTAILLDTNLGKKIVLVGYVPGSFFHGVIGGVEFTMLIHRMAAIIRWEA